MAGLGPDGVYKVVAVDGAGDDLLGGAAAMHLGVVLLGASQDDDRGANSGSVYIYSHAGTAWSQQQKLTAVDGAAGDLFGSAVAVSGDTAVVGVPMDDDRGTASGSVYIFTRTGAAWSQQQKLTAGDGAAVDQFGWSVAVEGGAAVVGARGDDDRGYESGAAYIFTRAGATWSQQQKLTASDGAAADEFGHSVSIASGTVLAGAPADDDRGANSGAMYAFARAGTTWSQQQKLTAGDGAAGDGLGKAVSLSGVAAVAGATDDDDRGTSSGAAYIFSRTGTSWSQQQKITADDGIKGDLLGAAVAMGAQIMVIGASSAAPKGGDSGAAYVYRRAGTQWELLRKLVAWDGSQGDKLGAAVAVSGSALVAGASGVDEKASQAGAAYLLDLCAKPTLEHVAKVVAPNGTDWDYLAADIAMDGDTALVGAQTKSGHAYVYQRTGAGWVLQQQLVPPLWPKIGSSHRFGTAVAIAGDTAFVGAPLADRTYKDVGVVYVFDRSGTTWTMSQILEKTPPSTGDEFGHALAMDGKTLVVGARMGTGWASKTGTAHVFEKSGGAWKQISLLEPPHGQGTWNGNFGYSVSISGDRILAGAYLAKGAYNWSGLAYMFKRNGVGWALQDTLSAFDATQDDRFGNSVSVSGNMAVVGAFWDDARGSKAGSAYVFKEGASGWKHQAKLYAPGTKAYDYFGYSVSLSANQILVGATGDDTKYNGVGAASLFQLNGATWVHLSKLLPFDGATQDMFGQAVLLDGGRALVGSPADDDKGSASGSAYFFEAPVKCAKGQGSACTAHADCSSGHCVDGMCCSSACGGGVADCQVCSILAGAAKDGQCGPAPSGGQCRASTGPCDQPESCDGVKLTCPPNGFKPVGAICRGATAWCDRAETCDGAVATCPADAVQPASHSCRPANGDCDVAEMCDGLTSACPADKLKPLNSTCRAASGACDVAEACDGTTPQCPSDGVWSSLHTCRGASGPCDQLETCDGVGKACPKDLLSTIGTTCRSATAACDKAETCDGASAACPADTVLPAGAVCRAVSAPCDQAETCDGSTLACPKDKYLSTGAACRPSVGVCDLAEVCTGGGPGCPGDLFKPAGQSCRPSSGECDLAEACSGAAGACPTDLHKPNGTPCQGGKGACAGGKCLLIPDGGMPDAGPDANSTQDTGAAKEAGPDLDAAMTEQGAVKDVSARESPGSDADGQAGGSDMAAVDPPGTSDGCSIRGARDNPEDSPAGEAAPMLLLLLFALRRRVAARAVLER